MAELLLILIALILVLLCGLFVAAEFAFVTVDRNRIEKLAGQGDKQARGVQSALRTLSTQLSGAQVGITITNLAIGFLAEPAIAQILRSPLEDIGIRGAAVTTISIAIAITIATIVTMLFGELVPKNLAISKPIDTAKKVQAFQRGFSRLMSLPITLLNGTANLIVRRLGIEPQEELASARSTEELLAVVKHSARKGTLPKDTAVLIERSLEFGDRHASDVMTPRVRLVTVEADQTVEDVVDSVRTTGFSRFPVIENEVDNIVGIIGIKDAVRVDHERRGKVKVSKVMQPAIFVPSSMELDGLIERMRDQSVEAVITIDEYGGVDGLVTLEDLVEELVGEVKDEHDETGVAIRRLRKNLWSVSGLLRSDEIAQELDVVLPEDEEFETIGGLVLDQHEEVPGVGDRVIVDALSRDGLPLTVRLTVTSMDGRRIDRLDLFVEPRQGVDDE